MKTTRGHMYEPTVGKQAVRIDRKTAYGNEFKIGKPHPDTGLPMTRDDVCNLFEERQLPSMDVSKLEGKHLLCWCKPDQRCHGDSIIRKIEQGDDSKADDALQAIADRIVHEHTEIQSLMGRAEDRAKIIGQHLIDLQPTLKAKGMSLSKFCKQFLPFGKTTAYDYINLAKGKQDWSSLIERKNSAPAEKASDMIQHTDGIAKQISKEPYRIEDCMGALAGMAWLYSQEFEGSNADAAKILYNELVRNVGSDDIGEEIAVDRIAWFLNFKEALDLAQVDLEVFLEEQAEPKLAA